MITLLNRAKLFTDTSSEAAANVREALKACGIPCETRTKQVRGAFGKAVTAGSGVNRYMGGMAASSFSDRPGYVYTIYVRRSDVARARAACHL